MQAYLTSWIPELGQDRAHNENMACSKSRPFINNAYLSSLKRKRTDSYDSSTPPPSLPALDTSLQAPPKRQKEETPAVAPVPASVIGSNAPLSISTGPAATPVKSEPVATTRQSYSHDAQSATTSFFPEQPMTPMQPLPVEELTAAEQQLKSINEGMTKKERAQLKITREIDLEILLKHKELRLIEQELAKCQVAYEQLRRCRIMPYPGQPGSTTSPSKIAYEGGASLEPARGYTRPQYPAAWGFTDGPYTQHYSRWLIPDPAFDSTPTRISSTKSFSAMESRSNRMGGLDRTSFSASRAHRASVGNGFQSLTGNFTGHKEKHGPLIVKRPSDGQWVKLVCKFCGKENISSVQGFLNHCRIAHDKNYESHNAAVDDSAQPLGPDEAPPLSTPVSEQPPLSAAPSVVSTPVAVVAAPPMPQVSAPRVHPLINNPSKPRTTVPPQSTVSTPVKETPPSSISKPKAQPVSMTFQNLDAESFKAAASTPKLSLLLKKRGVSGNLDKLVSSSKEQIDLDDIPYIHTDSDVSAAPSPIAANKVGGAQSRKPPVSGGRVPATGQPASKRAKTISSISALNSEPNSPITSSVGASPHCSRFPSSLCQDLRPADIDIPHSPMHVDEEMSPHTNPGLVTDGGEDDDESDAQSRSGSELGQSSAASVRVPIRRDDEHDDAMALDDNSDHGLCSLQAPVPSQNPAATTTQPAAPTEKRKRGRPSKKDAARK